MNRGLFESQINEISEILKKIGLREERIHQPHYPDNARALFKDLTYVETWELIYKEQYFHFRLVDDSLLQFRVDSYKPLCVHYAYYECPYEPRININEFEKTHTLNDEYDEVNLIQDYENYLLATQKDIVTPIRYDLDPKLYKPCLHPASHIHFGHNNNIRIAARKILNPLSFLLLIIRQVYPDTWNILVALKKSDEICRNIRGTLIDVEKHYWNSLDERQLYLA
jgi:hypothetical protein